MNNTNPYRHLDVNAEDILNMPLSEVCKIPIKVNNELECFGR